MGENLTDQLRDALRKHVMRTGQTYYAVAKACGIGTASIYRFRNSTRGLSHAAMGRLAFHLTLQLQKVQLLPSKLGGHAAPR